MAPRNHLLVALFGLLAMAGAWGIAVGEKLPVVDKIPLAALEEDWVPKFYGDRTLENLLLDNGLVILHFTAPRPPRQGYFQTFFTEELSALRKAALSVPYPCRALAVIPFGEKGRDDARTLLELAEREKRPPWAGGAEVFWEPTWPTPGLYLTLRPEATTIETPVTYLIGPDRQILGIRAQNEGGQLYDWLQANLPASVKPAPRAPSGRSGLAGEATGDWPSFRRDARRRAVAMKPPDTLPYTYLAWRARVGQTYASPAVSDGRVYLSTRSTALVYLDLATGAVVNQIGEVGGLWSSPAVAGELVYTLTRDGVVLALDSETLERRWSRDLGGLVTSSPTVVDGRLFIGARTGAVHALDAATGERLWRYQTGGAVSSSPAVADGMVLIGSGDRRLYALDAATGDVRWSAETSGAVDSSPTVSDGLVVVGSFDGGLYAFALSDGQRKWRCELGGWVHSSPAVADGLALVGTVRVTVGQAPVLCWVDLATGERKAAYEGTDSFYSSPTVWDDLVLIGCRDGLLYAFDRSGGRVQPTWTFATRQAVHASPVIAGDTILIASSDGWLYALRQAKPIHVWTDSDVVPRWFMAALVKQLHEETAELILRAAQGEAGQELALTPFTAVFEKIRAEVANPGPAPAVLPRDVPPDHPGAGYISYALTSGLLGGYPDGTFQPSQPSTRYQVAGGLAAAMEAVSRPEYVWRVLRDRVAQQVTVEVHVTAPRGARALTDVPAQHWAHQALTQLAQKGQLQVDEEGRFRGDRPTTLADAAKQWDLLVQTVRVVRIK